MVVIEKVYFYVLFGGVGMDVVSFGVWLGRLEVWRGVMFFFCCIYLFCDCDVMYWRGRVRVVCFGDDLFS